MPKFDHLSELERLAIVRYLLTAPADFTVDDRTTEASHVYVEPKTCATPTVCPATPRPWAPLGHAGSDRSRHGHHRLAGSARRIPVPPRTWTWRRECRRIGGDRLRAGVSGINTGHENASLRRPRRPAVVGGEPVGGRLPDARRVPRRGKAVRGHRRRRRPAGPALGSECVAFALPD